MRPAARQNHVGPRVHERKRTACDRTCLRYPPLTVLFVLRVCLSSPTWCFVQATACSIARWAGTTGTLWMCLGVLADPTASTAAGKLVDARDSMTQVLKATHYCLVAAVAAAAAGREGLPCSDPAAHWLDRRLC